MPASAVPGGEVEISGKLRGEGAAGAPVGITVKDPATAVFFADETKTDSSGSFIVSFTLPGDASCDDWQVQAAGGGASVSKTFTVDNASGVVTASPASVKPGNTVTLIGKVPQGGVTTGITVKNPNGGVALADQTTAGAYGGYTFQFNVPADAPSGTWTAEVAGGGTTGLATFTVTSGSGAGGGGGGGGSVCKQPAVDGYLPEAGAAGIAPDTEVSAVFDIDVDKVSSNSLDSVSIEDAGGNKVGLKQPS